MRSDPERQNPLDRERGARALPDRAVLTSMRSRVLALGLSAALCGPAALAPAAAQNPFGDRGADPIPGHTVHNQVPEAPPAALTWDELLDLDVTVENPAPLQTVFHVSYPDSLLARDGTKVSVKGFMYPLEAGETHTYFLLSALPPSCPFCLPASARGLVEVKCDEGVRYTLEPVVLTGRFELLKDDPSGLHYRLSGARAAG